jgi:hypothetical protein
MFLGSLALLCILLSAVAFTWVLVHAFRRSIGTGVMVLCIPFYNVYYGIVQFEHPRKNWIVALWLCSFGVGAVLWAVAMRT